ncbi:MAG: FeoB-associated Cys-rich membrane protein [Clostridia bacterium]|nr:FeoB-associated Cys-rich membrane protein [Clostridia bacterium]
MNVWDILILVCIAGIVLLALRVMRKTRKSGGCSACGNSCGCGCEKCENAKRGS